MPGAASVGYGAWMSAVDCSKCGASQPSRPEGGQCHYCGASLPRAEPAYPPMHEPPRNSIPQVIVIHHESRPSYTGASYFSWYWIVRLGIAGIFVLMSAGGWLWHVVTGKRAPAALSAFDDDGNNDWDGTRPLSCGGNDEIQVNGVKATFTAGSAITASGNCRVRCTDCTLKAPTAVEADGNGHVTLVNGSAEGTEASLVARGNGEIKVQGNATIVGPTRHSANGTISGVPSAAASSAHSAPAHSGHASPASAASAKKK